jgi:hypothetical protein
MEWFWFHGNQLFILFLVPVAGVILEYLLSRKATLYTLGISLFLLLPLFTDYNYTIPYAFQIAGLIALACLYSFYSKQIENKIAKFITMILISGLLFIILGYFAFMDSMSGSVETEQSWQVKNYKIDYVVDQGFAGGALRRYELSEYALIPLFIKKIDYSTETDSTNNCIIHFTSVKMDFNKCNHTIQNLK